MGGGGGGTSTPLSSNPSPLFELLYALIAANFQRSFSGMSINFKVSSINNFERGLICWKIYFDEILLFKVVWFTFEVFFFFFVVKIILH